MRPDGGEARQLTDTKDGVADFAFSLDGSWLAYRSGKRGQQRLYRLPIDDLFSAEPEALTDDSSGVQDWQWAPDSQSIYFIRADKLTKIFVFFSEPFPGMLTKESFYI